MDEQGRQCVATYCCHTGRATDCAQPSYPLRKHSEKEMGGELGLYGAIRLCSGFSLLGRMGVPNVLKGIHLIGQPNLSSLGNNFLLKQAFVGKFPKATIIYFQFVFGAINLILIAEALLGRMNFHAWMFFCSIMAYFFIHYWSL